MIILARVTDGRVLNIRFDAASLDVELMGGCTISALRAWFRSLFRATPEQRSMCQKAGGGYGIHWPEIDEELSTEALLRAAPAPRAA